MPLFFFGGGGAAINYIYKKQKFSALDIFESQSKEIRLL